MRRPGIVIVLLCVAATGCGDERADQTACELLGRDAVAKALRDAGASAAGLRRSRSESLDQSVCRYRAPATNVGLNVDSAPQARRRYFNRVTEALQFSVNDPPARPRPIEGLGDEDAHGPAGAYWIDDLRTLFVLRGERLFVYQVAAPRVGAQRARAAAVRLAAATLPGERRRAGAEDGREVGPLTLALAAPEDGEVLRSARAIVRGEVAGPDPVVRVAGRRAVVREGVFAGMVPLKPGRNRIRVVATSGGRTLTRTVHVRRGRSPSALGRSFARRRPGEMPEVLAESLADARAFLRGAGIPHRVVLLAPGSPERGEWAVCRTRPAAAGRARDVVLFADRADPLRPSGTVCAQD